MFVTVPANAGWSATAAVAAETPERATKAEDPNALWDLHVRALLDAKRRLENILRNGYHLPKAIKAVHVWHLTVIESQLRGLLHVHSVNRYPGEPWDVKCLDQIIYAHMPTAEEEAFWKTVFPGKSLTALVTKYMIHKCTDGYCCKKGKCRFGFPFAANPATYITEEGTVMYWRRATDSMVSTYSPWILLATDGHAHATVLMGPAVIPYCCGCAARCC